MVLELSRKLTGVKFVIEALQLYLEEPRIPDQRVVDCLLLVRVVVLMVDWRGLWLLR